MAKTPEGWVKEKVKKVLEEKGVWYTMPMTMGYGVSGVPDFLLCHKGMFISIETKYDCWSHLNGIGKNGSPTRLQKKAMEQIREAGGITLVIDKKGVELLGAILDDPHTDTVCHYKRSAIE